MTLAFAFAIVTGVCFGLQGAYGRALGGRYPASYLTWVTFAGSMPYLVTLAVIQGIPDVQWGDFAWSTAVSFLVNMVAFNLYFRALAASPLYLSMPFTAFTPLFLIPVAWVLLDELPGPLAVVGILLVFAGGYGIHLRGGNPLRPLVNLVREPGTRYMLIAALIWSISATVEKVAVRSSSPSFYAVSIGALLTLGYGAVVLLRHRTRLRGWMGDWRPPLILGAITGVMALSQFTALLSLPVSIVIAFKRAGVIVSVLVGYWAFGEERIGQNLAMTLVIVAGVALIMW